MGQAFSIICSSIFLFLLLEIKDPQLKLNIFYTWKSSILFSLLLISSMIGSLAAMLVDISVERVILYIYTFYNKLIRNGFQLLLKLIYI